MSPFSRKMKAGTTTSLSTESKLDYPWSLCQLKILPQCTLPHSPAKDSRSQSPFPRYGHSVTSPGTTNGEVFLFGGLVQNEESNDLFCISVRDQTACLWQVHGDVPSPRVGQASALMGSVLIVWGGDTSTTGQATVGGKSMLDDELYLLNLGSKVWVRIDAESAKPLGRYGHAIAIIGTRLYLFGGQIGGEFLNDLWSFDLNNLLNDKPRWEHVQSSCDSPPHRTGHTCIAHGAMLYLFGGTDGQFHYSDTWCFDTTTQEWTEMHCIGFIPAPREGHSAVVVDGVIYIFGGRGVDGKDMGDLCGFRISNKRWYMFQNMGPAPNARSGHAMSVIDDRVYVFGGESYASTRPDEPTTFHVLDTRVIKYPDGESRRET